MFVTQMSNYLFVISFQLTFHKTLRYRLARPLVEIFLKLSMKTVQVHLINWTTLIQSIHI